MYLDVVDLRDFYTTPQGRLVVRSIGAALAGMDLATTSGRVLGIGFATPYLDIFRERAERVLAFMPAGQGVIDWPAERASATALVEESALPLPDASMDVLLLVHALEMSPEPDALMGEARRVLANGGRLIAVVPNRQGPWARSDASPFGYGRPYSRSQLRQLLSNAGFEAEEWETALHPPPLVLRSMPTIAGALDKAGHAVWPAFSGVVVVTAAKRAVLGARIRAKRRFVPAFRPAMQPGLAGGYRRLSRKTAWSA
jgi:SAM-dependent methyltransferase